MRKAFNFYRSYYDVAKELSDKDRALFLWALLQKQFDGVEPKLTGMSNFAYISQKHNIDAQVLGYEAKTKQKIEPLQGGSVGGLVGGLGQGEEKGKVKEKEELINSRKLKFADTLKPFVEKYGAKMIRAFYDYWVEPNKSNTKFRQELQKTWDVKRRLEAWSTNESNFKPKQQQTYNHDNNGLI